MPAVSYSAECLLPEPMHRAGSSRWCCMQVVLSHALECSFIKRWNPDHAFLYVIFEEIKTSIRLSVVPPRERVNSRTASIRKKEVVIDGAQSCKMITTVACLFRMFEYKTVYSAPA